MPGVTGVPGVPVVPANVHHSAKRLCYTPLQISLFSQESDIMVRYLFVAVVVAAVVLCATAPPSPGADDGRIPLKKGDRIVFLGDSITAAGAGPKGYITLIKSELNEKHKDLGIEIIGAGISGHKVPDLQGRLERDVLKKKPTLVFIYIGINDVWHDDFNPPRGTPKDKYEAGLKDLIERVTSSGARVILCTPSVIGEKTDGSNKHDARLDEYAAISRKVAQEKKVPVCDLRKAFLEYLKENNKENKDKGVLTGDRVHLNEAGNKLVAETMLKMLSAEK
jgi:lysophospholipase L1-like esterase